MNRTRRELPVLQTSMLERRKVLLLGVAAAGVAACRADADIGFGIGPTAPSDDASAVDDTGSPNPDDSGNMPPDDTGSMPSDSGTTPHDSGSMPRDASVHDSGTTQPDVQQPMPDVQQPMPDVQQPMPDVQPACTPGPTRLGSVSQFGVGTWTLISSHNVIVSQDSGGLYAYSSICTHQGCACDPPDAQGQAFCACHGSLFDGNGGVINGPARRPLPHYAVTVCNGTVYLNSGMTVAASTRTSPAG